MKKLLLPFLAFFVLTACNKETLNTQEEVTSNQEIQMPNASFELPKVKDYLKEISQATPPSIESKPLDAQNKSGSIASKETIRNLAEDQVTCLEKSGHSSVIRTNTGALINYHAKGLTPGETYLIYVLVENFDENCFPDFSGGFFSYIDAVSLGEKTANSAGHLNLNTFLANGDNTNSWYGPLGYGMVNSKQANLSVFTRIGPPFTGIDVQVSPHAICPSFIGCS